MTIWKRSVLMQVPLELNPEQSITWSGHSVHWKGLVNLMIRFFVAEGPAHEGHIAAAIRLPNRILHSFRYGEESSLPISGNGHSLVFLLLTDSFNKKGREYKRIVFDDPNPINLSET